MSWSEPVTLGRSGLRVGRLGISSSYRAPVRAYEEAFERGCNYFTWGSFIKGRSADMEAAIQHLVSQGRRDELVLSVWEYTHWAWMAEKKVASALRRLGVDHLDVLMLGYHPKRPGRRLLEWALELRERGLVRVLGLSSHNRLAYPDLAPELDLDVFHVRYNAAHRGAETEVFPALPEERPGIVAFTATRWGALLNAKKMPAGEAPLTAAECYRFALSHPSVDVVMTGPRTLDQMQQNLGVLDQGPLTEDELERIRRIGDHVHG